MQAESRSTTNSTSSASPPHSPPSLPTTPRSAATTPQSATRQDGPPWRCSEPECGKSYASKKGLRAHAKSHAKPFKCRIEGCEYNVVGFGDKKGLDRHEDAVHELFGPEKLHCPVPSCPSIFPKLRMDNLNRHISRVHPEQHDALSDFIRDNNPAILS